MTHNSSNTTVMKKPLSNLMVLVDQNMKNCIWGQRIKKFENHLPGDYQFIMNQSLPMFSKQLKVFASLDPQTLVSLE